VNRAEVIAHNLAAVRARIGAAARAAGRDEASVRLIAVSKTMPADDVRAARAAGQVDFGENYAQELRDKRVALVTGNVAWHFIGPLQSNKVKYVAGTTALVHTIDTRGLAEEIHRRMTPGQVQPVLVQVNVAGETQKRGLAPAELPAFLDALATLPGLSCRGLMLIPPFDDDPETARPHFVTLRRLLETEAARDRPGVTLTELSMGMSHDLEVAVAEGATWVRVGTAIFGPRT
jgi:hypothetical protein